MKKKPVRVVEGIESLWVYHLTYDRDTKALCGASTMHCKISLDYFQSIIGKRREQMHDGRACEDCVEFLSKMQDTGSDLGKATVVFNEESPKVRRGWMYIAAAIFGTILFIIFGLLFVAA